MAQEIRSTVGLLVQAAQETQERLLNVETAVYGFDVDTIPGDDAARSNFVNLIAAVMPTLVAEDLVNVQPLKQKAGVVYYMKHVYDDNKGTISRGDAISTIERVWPAADKLTISSKQLILTSSNWNINQSVIFTAIDDNIASGDLSFNIKIKPSSTDTLYNNIPESPHRSHF